MRMRNLMSQISRRLICVIHCAQHATRSLQQLANASSSSTKHKGNNGKD